MSTSPGAVMREWFEQLWNQKQEDTIDRLLAPNGVAHGLGPEPIVGPDAFKAFYRVFSNAFPQFHVEVIHTVVEGDMVAACCHVTGVHCGPGMGVPSDAHVDFWGMTMARVKDGQLVEGWNSYDFMTCYQQMGVLPQPAL
jgi:predicted ester cyclase